jgi:hypothetical protein
VVWANTEYQHLDSGTQNIQFMWLLLIINSSLLFLQKG